MIIPPIVGVPDFWTCPSKPKSLILSPTCCFLKKLMILFPKIEETNNANIKAAAALNVINWNSPAPGKLKCVSK